VRLKNTVEARYERRVRGSCHGVCKTRIKICRAHFPFWASVRTFRGCGPLRSRAFLLNEVVTALMGSPMSLSGPHWHKLVSRRNLTQLRGTIRQVLASNSNDEIIRVHGWVKSVRLQKRIAFAMIHDGTTQKGLQVVFQDPTHGKVLV